MQVQWQSNSKLTSAKICQLHIRSPITIKSISVDCYMLIKYNLIFNNQTMNETVRVPPSSLFWLNLIKLGQKWGKKSYKQTKLYPRISRISRTSFLARNFSQANFSFSFLAIMPAKHIVGPFTYNVIMYQFQLLKS